jgi:hypothetical protein
MSEENLRSLCGGDVALWTVNRTTLHMKARTKFGDPVELNDEEVRELIAVLTELLQSIE